MKNHCFHSRFLPLLALLLAFLCLPLRSALAATTATKEAYAVLSTDNKTLTFYYDTYKSSRVGTIYTSSNFRTSESDGWGGSASTITTVTFNSSFADYTSLTSTAQWFRDMVNLTTINSLTYLYTGNVTSMKCMFYNCKNLTSLNVSGFNTEKVTNMAFLFGYCENLTSLDVSSFNTAKVTDMWGMFCECKKLTSLNVSNFTTSKVQYMSFMFTRCSSLTSLNVSNFNTSNVTEMMAMFDGCSGLTNLNLSNFNTSKVTDMSWMFYYCNNLTSLNISNFDTSNVTNMAAMFCGCNKLTSLDLRTFNTSKVTIMSCASVNISHAPRFGSPNRAANNTLYGMFENCSNLTTIHVGSSWTVANVTQSTDMFEGCTKLVGGDGTVYNSNYTDKTKAYAGTGGYLTMTNEAYAVLSTDNKTLTFYYDTYRASRAGTKYTSSNFRTSQSNGWGGSKSTITTVTFNYSFSNYTSLTSTAYWFHGMENLTTINGLSYLKTNNVTTMRNMFYNCKSLTSLNLSGFNTAKVTVMWNMFYNCQNLTSLDLSSFNTANVNDMDNLFYNCSKLVTIRVSSLWTTASVTYSSSMFYNCTSLVGGDGTVYNSNYTDKTKAYAGIGGYLTMEGQAGAREAYAVLSNDGTTLTFYYDANKSSRVGTIYTSSNFRTSTSSGWGGSQSTITTVTFDSSFADYTSLTSTAYWFYGMRILTTINGLSYLKTNNVTNMSSMFAFCISLTSLNVSSFNTAKVTNMYDMFYNCQSLSSLDLSNFSTVNVTNMGWMFGGCKGLTNLDVSSFYTAKVTVMYYMFYNCESLTSLNLSTFSTANVTDMSRMFSGCKGLTNLNVSSFNTVKVTYMGAMFYNCSSLTSLDLSSFNTGMVQSMTSSSSSNNNTYYYGMFGNCSNLETIHVGSQWTTDAVTSSMEMFYNCTSLVGGDGTVYDPNYTDKTKAYAGIGGYLTMEGQAGAREAYAVLSTDGTTLTFYYDANKSSRPGTIYTSTNFRTSNSNGWGGSQSTITTVTFDSSFADYTNLTSTAYWFSGMENLTTINGLNYLYTGNVTSMYDMFYNCKSLTSLNLSGFNTAKVTNMVSMFCNCESLVILNLSNFSTANVTDMSYMFSGCLCLSSLDLSNFNTSNVTDMESMFDVCFSLSSLDLSSFNTAKVTNMNRMFYGCEGLTSLNVSNFNTANVTDMMCMFDGCESLTSLNLSNFNTENVTDMMCMFYGCDGLTSLNVSSFNTANVTYMAGMFMGCSNLTSLDLSSFNTSDVRYMAYGQSHPVGMFTGCTNLKTIYVSDMWNVDNVELSYDMFKNCTSLVGGDGTTYDPKYTNDFKAYAGRGGYLTLKVDDDLQYYLNSLTDSEDSFEDGVYTRQFTNWDWQTLYVPFSMSYSNWQARFEVASITGVQQGENGPELVATILEEGATEPNTPYLIRAKVKAKSTLKVNATNIVDPQENVFGVASYNIHGNYGTINNLKENQKYRLRCNAFSIPESNDEVLPPYRWYLANKLVLVVDTITVICFSSIADGETTAVSEPMRQITERRANNEVYDLLGRKVRTDADGKAPLRKGLYIINNKKRIVK